MTEIPFELQREYFPVFDGGGNYIGCEYPKLVLRLDGDVVEVAAQDPTDRRLDKFCGKTKLSFWRELLRFPDGTSEEDMARALAAIAAAPIN